MQAALRWVRTNAAAFGGDPRRVMLFGQSFGGHMTTDVVSSAGSAGLFSAAAMHSGMGAQAVRW